MQASKTTQAILLLTRGFDAIGKRVKQLFSTIATILGKTPAQLALAFSAVIILFALVLDTSALHIWYPPIDTIWIIFLINALGFFKIKLTAADGKMSTVWAPTKWTILIFVAIAFVSGLFEAEWQKEAQAPHVTAAAPQAQVSPPQPAFVPAPNPCNNEPKFYTVTPQEFVKVNAGAACDVQLWWPKPTKICVKQADTGATFGPYEMIPGEALVIPQGIESVKAIGFETSVKVTLVPRRWTAPIWGALNDTAEQHNNAMRYPRECS